jgi:streptogramin lyase
MIIVYVTDVGNNRVERFTSNGLFVSQWGSIGSAPGQFNNPGRVAVDPSGNVYVADFGNDRIEKFDGNGKLITTWGSLGQNNGQFYNPTGMTVQFPQGNVYVVDTGNHRIQEFTTDGKFINKWDLPAGTSVISPITGIDIDVNSAGTIFLTDSNAGTISVISATPVTQK